MAVSAPPLVAIEPLAVPYTDGMARTNEDSKTTTTMELDKSTRDRLKLIAVKNGEYMKDMLVILIEREEKRLAEMEHKQ